MNKLAYTVLIAFVASLLTLIVATKLVPSAASVDTEPRIISAAELARHNTVDSCWKAINGRVYDVSGYIDQHPTPASVLTDWCGRESTSAWDDKGNGRGHSAFAERLLAGMVVGVLEGAKLEPLASEAAPVTQRSSELGAGTPFADGSYYAETEADSRGYIAVLELTVQHGRILSVGFDEIRRNEAGAVEYRKSADLNYADRWRAVSGVSQFSAYAAYERQLMEGGHPDAVDALSGATSAYDNFVGLARDLLATRSP